MEAILVCRIFAFSDAHKLLDLIHLRKQLLVLPVNELYLALLANDFVLSLLLVEVLAYGHVT